MALKNGGGIRASITGSNITLLTIESALAFDNKTAVVELTGDEFLAAMENAVSYRLVFDTNVYAALMA